MSELSKLRTAVIAADGCEEGELLTIVDIIRRGGIHCEIVGLDSSVITGAHNITFVADRILAFDIASYDMIVLPGGYGGTDLMCKSELLKAILCRMDADGKYLAAMCAAPSALDAAGILDNRNFTAYVGYDKKISHGHYLEDEVVVDQNMITSRGPATVYAFSYKLVNVLGGDGKAVADRMIYSHAFNREVL